MYLTGSVPTPLPWRSPLIVYVPRLLHHQTGDSPSYADEVTLVLAQWRVYKNRNLKLIYLETTVIKCYKRSQNETSYSTAPSFGVLIKYKTYYCHTCTIRIVLSRRTSNTKGREALDESRMAAVTLARFVVPRTSLFRFEQLLWLSLACFAYW